MNGGDGNGFQPRAFRLAPSLEPKQGLPPERWLPWVTAAIVLALIILALV